MIRMTVMMMKTMVMTTVFVWVSSELTSSHLCVFVPHEILSNDPDVNNKTIWPVYCRSVAYVPAIMISLLKIVAAHTVVVMMGIMASAITTSTDSHLCSFVLTQFGQTHLLAQHIWYSPRGDNFRNSVRQRLGGWKGSPPAPPTPFWPSTPPRSLCPLWCHQRLHFTIWSRDCVFQDIVQPSVRIAAWFQRKMVQELPRIAVGAGNGEDQVVEMVSTSGGEHQALPTAAATCSSTHVYRQSNHR